MNVILSPSLFAILDPLLFVILNEVKDLEGLRINFAKDLVFLFSQLKERFFTPPWAEFRMTKCFITLELSC